MKTLILFLFTLFPGIVLTGYVPGSNGDPKSGDIRGRVAENAGTQQGSITTDFVTQVVDHLHPVQSPTWQQRFFYNDAFYVPGSPIIILLGDPAEAITKWLQSSGMMELCQKINCLAVQLEERFTGDSWPINNTDVDSLDFLSTRQILADLAHFIKATVKTTELKDNKIIVAGFGPYSGGLAVMFREKYPHLVDIVWSSAAALTWKYDFPEYFEVVGRVIYDLSPSCLKTVQDAFTAIQDMAANGNGCDPAPTSAGPGDSEVQGLPPRSCSAIQDSFNLCQLLDLSNPGDVSNFLQTLAWNFGKVVQFNSDQQPIFRMGSFCASIFDNPNSTLTPVQKLPVFNLAINTLTNQSCTDFTQGSFCDQARQTELNPPETSALSFISSRTAFWLVCSQLANFQSSNSDQQPFGHGFPETLLTKQCRCAFDNRFTDPFIKRRLEDTLETYGGIDLCRVTTHVIFVNAGNDPWAPVSSVACKEFNPENKVILILGESQSVDLNPSSPTDSAELKMARAEIEATIKQWLVDIDQKTAQVDWRKIQHPGQSFKRTPPLVPPRKNHNHHQNQ